VHEGPHGRVAITGANGNLGRRLIERLSSEAAVARPVRAVVRSQRAATTVRDSPGSDDLEVAIVDYTDSDALSAALSDCDSVVHLVGIIKEGATSSYERAHEDTCTALADAAAGSGIRRIVYLSILGSTPESANACLASKGRAEHILIGGEASSVILQVPMVLGPGDYASRALRGQAQSRFVPLLRGGTGREQPIDADDVVTAVIRAIELPGDESMILELAGPEVLSRRQLLERSAALYGNSPGVIPIPFALENAAAALLERVSANPPLTRGMLGVLDHDDDIDPRPACERLDLDLTPLDDTLAKCVGPERTDA
jgi:uncharacterized protein YbjT (DUF2867 family)